MIRSLGLASSVSEKLAKFLVGWSAEGRESDGAVRVKLALTHGGVGTVDWMLAGKRDADVERFLTATVGGVEWVDVVGLG